jgi:hypothetical protein
MNIDFARLMEPVALRLLGKPNVNLSKPPKDVRYGTNGSLSINLTSGTFFDHENNVGGGVLDLIQHKLGCDHDGAVSWLRTQGLLPDSPQSSTSPKTSNTNKSDPIVDDPGQQAARKIVAAQYEYNDAAGTLALVVERIEFQDANGEFILSKSGKRKKTFRQKRPDPDRPGEWVWNVDGVPAVVYRLPELIEEAAEDHMVLIVEGEAKVDLLRSWNVPATCCAGGAKKWKAEHAEYLRNADVVLVPDNDDAGFKHIDEVGASLVGVAKRVRVLLLPGLPPKGDIIDWAKTGTREQLDMLLDQAPEWGPGAGPAASSAPKAAATERENELLAALAAMPPGVAFGRQRKIVAKDLGVSARFVDAELEARRSQKEAAPMHGHWAVEPWPEPVDGDSLLRDIIRCLRRHVVFPAEDDALAIALWIMFSWVHDEAVHSPILLVTFAERGCGKTTTLSLVSFLAPRCISTVEITEAALYRSITLWQPSFAIDEFDDVLSSMDDNKKSLRGVINSGHTRSQVVIRCEGDSKVPTPFSTFCPKAIGMNGRKLPDATLSRCIVVELRRRKTDEPYERFLFEDNPELDGLRRRLRRWSLDNGETVGSTEPTMPPKFDNRLGDNWRMQFAIADLCDGPEEWRDKARKAAVRLETASDTTSIGVRLLGDIKRILDEDGLEEVLSATLVSRLKEDVEGPWAEWGRGKGLTQNSLANLLGGGGGRGRGSRGGFGIRSVDVHKPSHGKGYKRSQFEDAWSRYLPKE